MTDINRNDAAVPSPSLSGKRILVADDSAVFRLIIVTVLQRHGAVIAEAADGAQAVALALASPFDLILMDIQMPVMDGRAATRAIRAGGAVVPIIAVSAGGSPEEQEACRDAGMAELMRKPVTAAALTDRVQRWLGARVTQDDGQQPSAQAQAGIAMDRLHAASSGDRVFARRLLELAMQELPAAAQQLCTACHTGDLRTIRQTAHRLGPCADSLLTEDLREIILRTERLAATGTQTNELDGLIQRLYKGITSAVDSIGMQLHALQ